MECRSHSEQNLARCRVPLPNLQAQGIVSIHILAAFHLPLSQLLVFGVLTISPMKETDLVAELIIHMHNT